MDADENLEKRILESFKVWIAWQLGEAEESDFDEAMDRVAESIE